MPEQQDERRELIGGEIVTMGFGKASHEIVKKNLNRILVLWLASHPIAELFPETLFQLDDNNSLIPDLSVVFPGRIAPGIRPAAGRAGSPDRSCFFRNGCEAGAKDRTVSCTRQQIRLGGLPRAADRSNSRRLRPIHEIRAGSNARRSERPAGFSTPVSAIFEGL